MRLLLTFLKRKLENGRMKSVHVEYVKRTFNMQDLFERTAYASYSLPLHFYLHFYYAEGGEGVRVGQFEPPPSPPSIFRVK